MTSAVNQGDLSKSLLAFVADGKYPDSEDVISANVTPDFLPKALQDISVARAQVEDEINSLSRDTASDVDGWMSQARQLRADIERSRETARNIVAQHERTQPLRAQVEDAAAKVQLMNTELAFNEGVTHILEEVQKFTAHIFNGRKAVEGEQIDESIISLEAAEQFIQSSDLSRHSNVASLVQGRLSSLRNDISNLLLSCWTRQVRLNKNELEIRPNDDTEQSALSNLITSLSRLDMFNAVNTSFQQGLLNNIIQPILMLKNPGQSCSVSVDDNGVRVREPSSSSISDVIDRLLLVFRYLQEKLPTSMSASVAEVIIPRTSTMLSEHWLTPNIPLNLEGIQNFESTLIRVTEFTGAVESLGWKGQEELVSWVNQLPRLWLTRRRVDSLDQVRRILVQSKGSTKEVQRVEKEVVNSTDDVLLDTGVTDDWDANWGNESEGEVEEAVQATTTTEANADVEDDVDAWGLGEEEEEEEDNAKENEGEHDEDAWGWGDDVDEEPGIENHKPDNKAQPPIKKKHEDPAAEKRSATKEITLTEHYTITDIPDSVIALIQQQVTDSASLATPEFSSSRVSASGNGLLALPTLILAMFKAIASSFYSLKLNAGHIYLYNDSLYLAEQVRNLVEQHELRRLTADVEGLERFGKLSYSKEMQTQRTIVTDLLDGSQGFVQCSEQPFLRECENAVEATVDRVRSVFKEWQPILSHSALLQAMGSLLSSVINKVIIDVEDLSDISEAESQTLVTFCNKISTLEDMFIPEPGVDATSMAAVDGDIALPESTGPILVPTGLRRYALSTLVNNLLGNDKPIPLEFLVNGTYLRTSIDEYLTANGISAETTLEVEYVRALIPPLHIASFLHDDWVSSVDVLSATSVTGGQSVAAGQERILSGSYDGLLRMWNMSSQTIAVSPDASEGGHTASIKAAKFISPTQLASAGLDRTVRVWKYAEEEDGSMARITPQLELYGHKSGIESLAIHAPSNRMLSASADHTVGFWSTRKSDAPTAPAELLPSSVSRSSKRRKLNSSVSTAQRGPLALLSSHTGPVSAAIFDAKDSTVGYSASWDHSLRTWDLVTSALVDTRSTSHPLLSLEHLPELHLLAAGTSARHITLIDPRASATSVSVMTLRGHTNAVVTLARDPNSTYGLISGSHDGTCRIWDVRSTKTDKEGVVGKDIYSIPRKSLEESGREGSKRIGGDGIKVFGVCWDRSVGIVSAGEDKRIQINRGEGVLQTEPSK
ncbi:hypothetical protein TCE0_039f12836 [Talaromyces pinophilus]|uniref:Ribosome biogenesis protein YTM1 n=1 Tax=Talaromyces pinophilus TaxID=128442 RepID=A0A6N4SL68_TALPI|nr:hypothetical protein TCE0_039f12836 [Talaromyces pinophilus]